MSDTSEIPFVCPHCQQEFLVIPQASACLTNCPNCQTEVVIAGEDGSTEVEPSEPEEAAPDREEELDGIRIRQLARERRATYRTISYLLIAAVVSAVSAAQCLWDAWLEVRGHLLLAAMGYVIFAGLLVLAAVYFSKRTVALRKEVGKAEAEDLAAPATPPDFSSLGDGSQTVKNLERMGEAEESAQV